MIKIRPGDFVKECYITVNGVRVSSVMIPTLNHDIITIITKDENKVPITDELAINMVHYTDVILVESIVTGCEYIDTKLFEVYEGVPSYQISIKFKTNEITKNHSDRWEYC